MAQPSPVPLPEAQLDARRFIMELAQFEAEVQQLLAKGLLYEAISDEQVDGREHSGGEAVRKGDLVADFRAYQDLKAAGDSSLAQWARAVNLAWHVTGLRRDYYAKSVELGGGASDGEAEATNEAYGVYCATLWQALRSEAHGLR